MASKTERRLQIWRDIDRERQRQDEKWGVQNHGPVYWAGILTEEVGEVAKAVIEYDLISYEKELIQAAAVAIAALESLFRNYPRDATFFAGKEWGTDDG